jgi:hypothetical protein
MVSDALERCHGNPEIVAEIKLQLPLSKLVRAVQSTPILSPSFAHRDS